jgi:uncharacterized damage-inducible protein DinB
MIAQTSWAERTFDFNFPVGIFPIIVERLRGAPIRLQSMLRDVNAERITRKIDGKWSILEQVTHLCNSEEVWYGRIEDFLSGMKTFQTRTLKTGAMSENLESLLQNFSAVRNKLIILVENMNDATASLTIIHPRLQRTIRLIDSLFTTAEHDDHHLAKIRELLA